VGKFLNGGEGTTLGEREGLAPGTKTGVFPFLEQGWGGNSATPYGQRGQGKDVRKIRGKKDERLRTTRSPLPELGGRFPLFGGLCCLRRVEKRKGSERVDPRSSGRVTSSWVFRKFRHDGDARGGRSPRTPSLPLHYLQTGD